MQILSCYLRARIFTGKKYFMAFRDACVCRAKKNKKLVATAELANACARYGFWRRAFIKKDVLKTEKGK